MRLLSAIIFLTALFWANISLAQSRCALSLVLAIDVSSSVDENEYGLQMHGLANALRDREVVQAILDRGGIQLLAFEWSGRSQQINIFPWSYLDSEGAVFAAASAIAAHPRGHIDMPTALGFALGYAAIQLDRAPLKCARHVVDVSGDGINNDGYEPFFAYKNFPYGNVQVNGLVIAGARPDPVRYFKQKVIHGPGAFIEVAADFDDYERAMKRKLLREIYGASLSMID